MSELRRRANLGVKYENERFEDKMGRARLDLFKGSRLPPIAELEIDKEHSTEHL